ncbi:18S rRNA (guanine-N(7))-methyltransferase RID2-like isoform X1 [Amaranthus tricolor]|uniref:18S rRNA (guanine-N(7))-methyltransferase RID2-like isoform X1 n=1 Tax=Amaranthus tricolor TaxID=29722 RepID=UPI002588F453|nr:18S rRNA (guanine-N(7))-methyltransferase RID2-like isoform X1 [Amaranthus tricolor]
MASRPELLAPPEIFYDQTEARKYTSSSRIIDIQAKLSERALELLALPDDGVPRLLLDIGCGSGLSGETLSENGHNWIGLDISQAMLDVALEREAEGDLLLADMGQGLGLRPGVIDGAISISAVQWLCNADKSSHEPRLRLKAFFGSLYRCLARGARAVLQVYPQNVAQRELILGFAMRAGFAGGVVVDYPHSTKSRKEYLVLTCGPPSLSAAVPKAKGEDGEFCSDDESSGDEENKTVSLNMSLNTVSLLLSCSTTIYNSLCFIEFATYILRVIRKQSLCYYKGKVRLVLTTLKNILGDSQLLA